jgi:hypothetical protein
MQPGTPPSRDRNWRGWIIATLAALVLILLLVLWGMRPSRHGQPGESIYGFSTASAANLILTGPGAN